MFYELTCHFLQNRVLYIYLIYLHKVFLMKGAVTIMKENLLMLFSIEEIRSIIMGLKISLESIYRGDTEISGEEVTNIENMLKKMQYVEHEYSDKTD